MCRFGAELVTFFIPPGMTEWLAQLGERRSAEREVTGSNPGRTNTQGLSLSLRRKCCLCNHICKRLDFLVFSDKEEKP